MKSSEDVERILQVLQNAAYYMKGLSLDNSLKENIKLDLNDKADELFSFIEKESQ